MEKTFTRRSLLTGAAKASLAAGVVAAIGTPAIVGAAGPTKLTFGHGAAAGNPRSLAAERFAAVLKEKSGGALEAMIAGSAQLGDDVAMLTSLRTGVLAISANSQGPASSLVPETAALGLPFLFANSGEAFKVLQGGVGDHLKKKFDDVGIVVLGWWDNGIRHITNSKRPIKMPDDLKGLKIRTPSDPVTMDIFKALGAATVQITFSELYVALQQGVVDGQENPLTNIASSKLHEVNKYISLSAHKWESTPVLMSKAIWSKLDKAGQDAVMAALADSTALQARLMNEQNDQLLKEFKANPAVAVNEVERAEFRKKTAAVIDDWQGKPFGAFVKDLRKTTGV